jgi:chemotaxis protein histidine kinase CheA
MALQGKMQWLPEERRFVMARKLTDVEHALMELVRDEVSPLIPSAKRNLASGFASALVRLKDYRTDKPGLEKLLQKVGLDDKETEDSICSEVLVWYAQDNVFGINDELIEAAYAKVTEEAEAEEAEADKEAGVIPENEPIASADDAEPEPEAEAAPEVETPQEEPKQKRTRRRRTKKAAAEAEEAENASEAPAPEEGTPEPEEAPKKPRRRTRRKAQTEEAKAEPEAAAAVPEADVADASQQDGAEEAAPAEAPRKRRRRTHRIVKAQKEASEAEDSKAEAPAETESEPVLEPEREAEAEEAAAEEAEADEALGIDGDAEGTEEAEEAEAPAEEAAPEAPKRPLPPKPSHSRDLRKIPYVRRGGETDAEIRQKIVQLDERFWMNGWLLSHPKAYVLFEHEIETMNDILQDGMLPGDITRRQLAYQMGGDEKFFEYGSDGFRLLRALGMEDIIRHRPLPKSDLVYHAPRRRKHMRVLVTENLDPYLDVHDLMYEDGRTTILGERIHAVVLGGGTPIIEHNRLSLLLDTLGADSIEVLYWGDIDRAGISIMNKLERELNGRYGFAPFAPAYELMVKKASERFPDAQDNESTKQVNIEDYDMTPLLNVLSDEAAAYAKTVVDSCELIPQEILVKQDL